MIADLKKKKNWYQPIQCKSIPFTNASATKKNLFVCADLETCLNISSVKSLDSRFDLFNCLTSTVMEQIL